MCICVQFILANKDYNTFQYSTVYDPNSLDNCQIIQIKYNGEDRGNPPRLVIVTALINSGRHIGLSFVRFFYIVDIDGGMNNCSTTNS